MATRADVVDEPGQGQRGGAGAAADRVVSFEDADRRAAASQLDRRREPVRTGADDDGVVHAHGSP